MEVPRLGVELELQLPNYATAHSNTGSLTHWVRPRIKPPLSWILVRSVSAEPRRKLLCWAGDWTYTSAGTWAAAVGFLTHCTTARTPKVQLKKKSDTEHGLYSFVSMSLNFFFTMEKKHNYITSQTTQIIPFIRTNEDNSKNPALP